MRFEYYKRIHQPFYISTIKSLLKHLVSVIEFVHIKSILHLNVVDSSIAIRYDNDDTNVPVLIYFSCSVHCASVRKLTPEFTEIFKSTSHLPHDVIQGRQMPSSQSHIYSIGI